MAICTVITVKEKEEVPVCEVGTVWDETLQACIPEWLAEERYGIKVWQWMAIAGAAGIVLAILKR